MKFELDEIEQAAALAFFEEEDKKAFEKQILTCEDCTNADRSIKIGKHYCFRHIGGRPYYGASGGARSYRFTPSGIGTFVEVEHGFTGAKKNITNMDGW